jgi:hypothetical protein
MSYKAHNAYVAPAQVRPQIGWLMLGFVLACVICVLWVIALFGTVFLTPVSKVGKPGSTA